MTFGIKSILYTIGFIRQYRKNKTLIVDGSSRILTAFLVLFSTLLVKIDKKEVKTCGRKSIEEFKFLSYNKYEKIRKFQLHMWDGKVEFS